MDHDGEINWALLQDPQHAGVQKLIADLNRLIEANRRSTSAMQSRRGLNGSLAMTPATACSRGSAAHGAASPARGSQHDTVGRDRYASASRQPARTARC